MCAKTDENDIMILPVSPPWSREQYTFMYLRKAYKDLHSIIWEDNEKTLHVLILGNPGIGKSVFALYELCHALKAGKKVVF